MTYLCFDTNVWMDEVTTIRWVAHEVQELERDLTACTPMSIRPACSFLTPRNAYLQCMIGALDLLDSSPELP